MAKRKRKPRGRKHRIERCVRKLKHTKGINPYAVCTAAQNKKEENHGKAQS